jgi:nitroimidazol reductase NimA-like FMN-containing flavoprotein (pyridoxamine 5'-phosphate oxidase superfamily)
VRRKDKEITDRVQIDEIIRRSAVIRLALVDNGTPYIVPMCFGYDGSTFYLHSAKEGRKIEVLRRNPRVCFELDTDCELKESEKPCSFSMKYRSVVGYGTVSFVEEKAAKARALNLIMNQYAAGEFSIPEEPLEKIEIIAVHDIEMTGKKSGY